MLICGKSNRKCHASLKSVSSRMPASCKLQEIPYGWQKPMELNPSQSFFVDAHCHLGNHFGVGNGTDAFANCVPLAPYRRSAHLGIDPLEVCITPRAYLQYFQDNSQPRPHTLGFSHALAHTCSLWNVRHNQIDGMANPNFCLGAWQARTKRFTHVPKRGWT